jgi:hypothetical protein
MPLVFAAPMLIAAVLVRAQMVLLLAMTPGFLAMFAVQLFAFQMPLVGIAMMVVIGPSNSLHMIGVVPIMV